MVIILIDHLLLNILGFEFHNNKMVQVINFNFKKSCSLFVHFQLVSIMMKSSLMHDNDYTKHKLKHTGQGPVGYINYFLRVLNRHCERPFNSFKTLLRHLVNYCSTSLNDTSSTVQKPCSYLPAHSIIYLQSSLKSTYGQECQILLFFSISNQVNIY